jgi:hypothetical protein
MKLFLLCLIAGACFAEDSPFACDRSALTVSARKHHFDEVLPALRKLVKNAKELPDGYAFELPTDSVAIQLAAEFASNERLCCPFLDITLRIARERGRVLLELTGREGTKEFIRTDFAKWF